MKTQCIIKLLHYKKLLYIFFSLRELIICTKMIDNWLERVQKKIVKNEKCCD